MRAQPRLPRQAQNRAGPHGAGLLALSLRTPLQRIEGCSAPERASEFHLIFSQPDNYDETAVPPELPDPLIAS